MEYTLALDSSYYRFESCIEYNVVIAPKYDFGKHPIVTSDWQCGY